MNANPTPNLSRRRFLATAAAIGAAAPILAATAGSTKSRTLMAGAAASNITLPLGATNGGVIARGGPATHIHDELWARALALDDGTSRVALCVCDQRMIARPFVDRARQLVADATGLPPDNLLIAATHTHAAPAAIGLDRTPLDAWYLDFLVQRIADAVRRALANLAPAQLGCAVGAAPQHVFNRRWRMRPGTIPPNPFGEKTDQVLMNPPPGSPDLLDPAGPVDPEVTILSVRHADNRPLALLANYGVHYVGGYQGTHVSADYFGIFADRVQELLGADRQDPPFVAIMSNGASGDVNNTEFRAKRTPQAPWTRMKAVAHDLAAETVRVSKEIAHTRDASLAVAATDIELAVRRPDPARLAWAEKLWASAGNPRNPTRPETYAFEALQLAKYPPAMPVRIQAIRIGALGLAAIPCEVFAETGLAIKAASPLKPACVMELANGYNGYLPTPEQHKLGGYETWPARSACLETQAETTIRATALRLLEEVSRTA